MGCQPVLVSDSFISLFSQTTFLKNVQLHAAFPKEVLKSEAFHTGPGECGRHMSGKEGPFPGCISEHLINRYGTALLLASALLTSCLLS